MPALKYSYSFKKLAKIILPNRQWRIKNLFNIDPLLTLPMFQLSQPQLNKLAFFKDYMEACL
jgi:hypothetical protein